MRTVRSHRPPLKEKVPLQKNHWVNCGKKFFYICLNRINKIIFSFFILNNFCFKLFLVFFYLNYNNFLFLFNINYFFVFLVIYYLVV